jgi:hypothetical protein
MKLSRFSCHTLFFGAFFLISGCGGSDDDTKNPDDSVIVGRNGVSLQPISLKFFDGNPRIDKKGSRLIYVSGQDQTTPAALKLYKWSPETVDPVRVTDEELGSEIDGMISPDGEWIALKAVNKDGNVELWLQKYGQVSIRKKVDLEISAQEKIEELAFSESPASGGPLLAFSTSRFEAAGVGASRQLYVLPLQEAGGAITYGSPAKITLDNALALAHPAWSLTQTPDSFQLSFAFVKSSGEAGVAQTTVSYHAGSLTVPAAPSIVKNIDHANIQDTEIASSNTQVLFTSRLLKSPDAAVNAGSPVSKILPKERVQIVAPSASESTVLASTQYQFDKMAFVDGNRYLITLGSEFIACSALDFYGKTVMVYDLVNKTRNHLVMVRNADAQSWQLTNDPCSIVTAKEKVTQLVTDVADFAAGYDVSNENPFRVALQIRYDTDIQILHLAFNLNEKLELTTTSVKTVGSNRP